MGKINILIYDIEKYIIGRLLEKRLSKKKYIKLKNLKQRVGGSFILEMPFKEGSIDKISYRVLEDKLMLYFYHGDKKFEFKVKDIKFIQLK